MKYQDKFIYTYISKQTLSTHAYVGSSPSTHPNIYIAVTERESFHLPTYQRQRQKKIEHSTKHLARSNNWI